LLTLMFSGGSRFWNLAFTLRSRQLYAE